MMRKIAAILVLVAAGIGVLLCIGGLIGVWVANTPTTDAVLTTTQTAAQYLDLMGVSTSVVGSDIEKVRTQLDALGARVEGMTAETRAEIAGQLRDSIQQQFGPTIRTVRDTLQSLRTSLIALNRSLESANRLPGVNVPTLTDELQAADERLAAIHNGLNSLLSSIADRSIDGSQIRALIATTSTELAGVEETLERWNAQITAVRGQIAALGDVAPGVIDTASIVLSLLFVLFGAGQACLLFRALKMIQA